jgi:hypothetical protein
MIGPEGWCEGNLSKFRKLLLRDQSRAGRKILSILQDRQRSTNLVGKSSENTLRIPVPEGYLNTTLSILSTVAHKTVPMFGHFKEIG